MRKVSRARAPRLPKPVDVDMLIFEVIENEDSLVGVRSLIKPDGGLLAMFDTFERRSLIHWLERVEHFRSREKLKGRR